MVESMEARNTHFHTDCCRSLRPLLLMLCVLCTIIGSCSDEVSDACTVEASSRDASPTNKLYARQRPFGASCSSESLRGQFLAMACQG